MEVYSFSIREKVTFHLKMGRLTFLAMKVVSSAPGANQHGSHLKKKQLYNL